MKHRNLKKTFCPVKIIGNGLTEAVCGYHSTFTSLVLTPFREIDKRMLGGASSGRVHDRVQLLLATTPGRRCRMQGLNDASMHYGWIHESEGGTLAIEVGSKRNLNPGDFLFFEVSTANTLLTFVAYIIKQAGDLVTVQLSSEIEERQLKSESRLKVRSFPAQINHENVEVVDISTNGFGFIAKSNISSQIICNAVLYTPQGDVNVKIEVRHAVADKNNGNTRAGALVKEMDRISRARWARMLGE